jgi:hypothetical protein
MISHHKSKCIFSVPLNTCYSSQFHSKCMQFVPSRLQFQNSFAAETEQMLIICGTPFPFRSMVLKLPCTRTTALQRMNLRFWSIRCRDKFLHKSSMFGLTGEAIILGPLFSNYTLLVPLADMMHSQYTITSHLQQLAINFDAGSISRLWKVITLRNS